MRGRVGGLWGARAGRRLNCRVQAYQWPGSSGAEESRTVTTQAAQRAVPFNRMGARRTTATPVGPATASPGSPRLPPNRPPTPTRDRPAGGASLPWLVQHRVMPASSEAGRALEALREKERQRADRSAARPREAVGAQSPTRVIRGTVSKAPATPPARAGKGVQMKRLVQEVELESMKGLMEGVGAELLSAEKWSWLKKQIYLEECWRPQVSLLVSVGFKAPDLERLVDARSDILDFKPQGLKAKFDFMKEELGLPAEDVKRIVLKCPRILEYKPNRTIAPRLAWLVEELGIPKAEMGKIVLRAPQVMSLSLEESLKARVDYLVAGAGVDRAALGKVVRNHPLVLTYSEDSMQKRVEYLSTLGLTRAQVGKAVTAHPHVLHYRIPAMRKRVLFLEQQALSREQIVDVLVRMPQVFSLDIEANLKPKVEYLRTQMGATSETLVKYPGILTLSLANRIVPRHKFMAEVGYPVIHPLPPNLLKCSDQEFAEKLGTSVEAYAEFRERIAKRLTQEGIQ